MPSLAQFLWEVCRQELVLILMTTAGISEGFALQHRSFFN